jgi:hypothetical protein
MDLEHVGIAEKCRATPLRVIPHSGAGHAETDDLKKAQVASPIVASPSFEEATVKLNTDGGKGGARVLPNGLVEMRNGSLRTILQGAFNVQGDTSIVGGPPWLDSDRFDIIARPRPARPRTRFA